MSDLGEVDSGSSSTLADFIARGFERFPAAGSGRQYMLILSDHGGGYWGFGQDAACRPGEAFDAGRQCSWMSMQAVTEGGARRLPR